MAAHADRWRRGRDSRWAPTCSSAAADCRGGTAARHWSRDGCRGIEVGVVADLGRHGIFGVGIAVPGRPPAPRTSARTERKARESASRRADQAAGAERHEGVQGRPPQAAAARRPRRPKARPRGGGEIDDLIADRHAATKRLIRPRAPEHAERQVLDREVRVGPFADLDPAPESRAWVSLICCIDVSSPVIGDAAVAVAEQPRRVDQRRSD